MIQQSLQFVVTDFLKADATSIDDNPNITMDYIKLETI